MLFAEITGQLGVILGKEATPLPPCRLLFTRVRPHATAPTVRPSLASAHHLSANVLPAKCQTSQAPTKVIMRTNRDLQCPMSGKCLQRRTRGISTGLTNLRGINALQAKFEAWTS